MSSTSLGDRLRAIVGTGGVPPTPEFDRPAKAAAADIERVLGGVHVRLPEGSCFVVERRADPEARYGRGTVGRMAATLRDGAADAALLTPGSFAAPPFLFFDLETTGLNGGAGTHAFIVGCGSFSEDGAFVTRQFVLLRHVEERALLRALAHELARAGALVTFNGKAFDAPLIESRCLFHRVEWSGAALPHVDVLHPARRLWGRAADTGESSCSLTALEQTILGARRGADVPGCEIPARYFRFLRTGDPRPLAAVLEHNRLDLLSLAGLTARLLDLLRAGPAAAHHPREVLAIAGLYARSGQTERACAAYEHAMVMERGGNPMSARGAVAVDACRALALLCRRARRYDDAAAYWRELLTMPFSPAHVVHEAAEALAIYHEHRARDLAAARTFALRSLSDVPAGAGASARHRAAHHRLARIERKMSERAATVRTLPLPS